MTEQYQFPISALKNTTRRKEATDMDVISDQNYNKRLRDEDLTSELRSRLCDLSDLPQDHDLIRWIHATSGDLERCEAMYRRSAQWRTARRVAELLTWAAPSVLQTHYPGGRAGYDADNCPVWIIPFGTADVKGILRSASKEDFVDYTIKIVETSLTLMREKSQEEGSCLVTQHVFIFDLEGFSLVAATNTDTLNIIRQLISIYEKNYPETLKAAYVINAGSVFQLVFRLVQALVHQRTLGKIRILGSDAQLWPAEVRAKVEQFGPEINRGGQVPRELYLENDSKKTVIGPGESLILKFCEESPFQLSWMFMTEGGDLEYRVARRDGKDREEDVVTRGRVPGNKEIASGHLICQPSPCIYSIILDNSHSFIRRETLFYKCDVGEIEILNRN